MFLRESIHNVHTHTHIHERKLNTWDERVKCTLIIRRGGARKREEGGAGREAGGALSKSFSFKFTFVVTFSLLSTLFFFYAFARTFVFSCVRA